jgi:hypothetical protein
MSNNKQTHGFCKIPHKKCTLSYCDENGCIYDGCIYERRNLVGEPIEMSNKQQTALQQLKSTIKDGIGNMNGQLNDYKSGYKQCLIDIENLIDKQLLEMEKEYYTEFEVLQLLLKLQQAEYYDNLYDWFQENKKQTFNTKENGGNK